MGIHEMLHSRGHMINTEYIVSNFIVYFSFV